MSEPRLSAALEYHVANTLGWSDLRPLQRAAIDPIVTGHDSLLIAPTAGGKTEAALFPTLTRMADENWSGLSVIYVAPLKALLNNLLPRLEQYSAWLGRRTALWHGDIPDGARRQIISEPPDILLTTPESLEAILVSRRIDHRLLFRDVRVVVADEIHAFAAGDRGWHLVAVLERLQRIAAAPMQRIGLSATLGNPEAILKWFQGGGAAARSGRVVTVDGPPPSTDIALDYVGSIGNAARVIASLHHGEKRLVFCESRSIAEQLAFDLRELGVSTFVSHSSLSLDERRQSERAFAEARDCVIVATSTLELGIDIGDLDRMIQIDAPRSVSSFLQRLGRTGRRAGTTRNALFLATEHATFLRTAGLLHLWGSGFVEQITPPPSPRHLAAQQFLALALQEGRFSRTDQVRWWGTIGVMEDGAAVLDHLVERGFLAEDGGWLFMGRAAERAFGGKNFLELLSTFVAGLELSVRSVTKEIGSVQPISLNERVVRGETPLLLAGRAWKVTGIDWNRQVVDVEPVGTRGVSRWSSDPLPESFEMVQARRSVLLGEDPPVVLSSRAAALLPELREEWSMRVDDDGLVAERTESGLTLWSMAGLRAHETIAGALPPTIDVRCDNETMRFDGSLSIESLRGLEIGTALPFIPDQAVDGLKFSVALDRVSARRTLAERFVDRSAAEIVAASAIVMAGAEG